MPLPARFESARVAPLGHVTVYNRKGCRLGGVYRLQDGSLKVSAGISSEVARSAERLIPVGRPGDWWAVMAPGDPPEAFG